jgi:predicted RNase H-like HicB family nuclease
LRRYTVLFERDEDGMLIARVPSLQGCHAYASTWDELHARLREVVELCLADAPCTDAAHELGDELLIGAVQLEFA